MPKQILAEVFVPDEHLRLVADFDCGDEVYQKAIASWIKGVHPSDSVITDMRDRGTRVWLYTREDPEPELFGDPKVDVVGFGSLGTSTWDFRKSPTVPVPDSVKRKAVPVSIIPNVAVAKKFLGYPPGDTFAEQILDDLIAKANATKATHPLLTLAVHPDNQRAIHFYSKFGLVQVEPPMKDGHLRMAMLL